MKRNSILAVLVLVLFSMKSFAADISGQVTTADGVPICALVLASGKSMFSCNPIGQFSLEGLALEADGSINLQVYADGFMPFYRSLTQFGDQSVVMTYAGSCPVDSDGLSDRSPLDGTYTLARASITYNDNLIVDTAGGIISVEGTMTITGNVVTQVVSITFNGEVSNYASSAELGDYGYYWELIEEGYPDPMYLALVERGQKVVTEFNTNQIGGDFSEVDHWVKVSDTNSLIREMSASGQLFAPSAGRPGSILGEAVNAAGLRSAISRK